MSYIEDILKQKNFVSVEGKENTWTYTLPGDERRNSCSTIITAVIDTLRMTSVSGAEVSLDFVKISIKIENRSGFKSLMEFNLVDHMVSYKKIGEIIDQAHKQIQFLDNIRRSE